MNGKFSKAAYSVPWNLFLITLGSLIFAFGLKGIAVPKGLITGGISGVSLLLYYFTDLFSPGIWYFMINIPIFLFGWVFVSRRFLLYSLYGMAVVSVFIDRFSFQIPVQDPFLCVLAGGMILGAGGGITLHSLGSLGGNDIIGIILNQKFNVRIGSFFFAFNLVLFLFSFGVLPVETVLYSLAMSFVISYVVDSILSMFNQRKMVLVISRQPEAIAKTIHKRLNRGATFLNGKGTYSGEPKEIVLTVVNNYQLKILEEAIFTIDPEAFVITENTFNVLGKGFSRRKVY